MKFPSSWLFTPGSRPDRFAKAAATDADTIILDLEDAVAEQDKVKARSNVIAFLEQRSTEKQKVCVRINPMQRLCGIEDLAALMQRQMTIDYILVPKAEVPAELALVGHILAEANCKARLVALVESAKGIVNAPRLSESSSCLAALFFGAADYAADLGQQVGTFEPDYARAVVINAAAAGGLAAIDSPFFAID